MSDDTFNLDDERFWRSEECQTAVRLGRAIRAVADACDCDNVAAAREAYVHLAAAIEAWAAIR